MSKWTNIQTGEVIDSPGVPSGGSDAGWVPGTTAPAPGTTTPAPYPGTPTTPPISYPPMPPGMIPDPSGAPMPLNPTPGTVAPFQDETVIAPPAPNIGTGWYDEVTGKDTPAGVGTPRPIIPLGEHLLNQDALTAAQGALGAAGIAESEWGNYISKPDAQGKLYYNKPATLTSPTGEKRKVATGSAEANNLLSSGWTLGDKLGGGTITSNILKETSQIDIGTGTAKVDGSLADQAIASIEVDIKSTQDQIKANLKLLKAPESDLSVSVQKLLDEAGILAGEQTGRGAMQATEEAKRKIEEQQTAINDKTTELNKKVAEVKALEASYNLANQQEEGRPQTLSRLQGAQAQNYKMYLAQKNALVAEAGYMQSELLGLQGKLDSAQKAADRAVALEYMDREAEYNAKINQLNILLPQLKKEEADYAQALQMTLTQQADALAEQKANKKAELTQDLSLLSKGYTYVRTPLERDSLRDKGYEILEIGGRTYANKKAYKAPKTTTQKTQEQGGYPKGFWTSVKTATTSLQKGEKWGTVFNRIKMQFPNISNEDIDTAMGTEWRKEGAFEEFKQKQYKETAPRKFELEAGVWQWLASEEAANLTNEQKKQEIMGAGHNPDDFGIY